MFSVPELLSSSSLPGLANSVRLALDGIVAQAQTNWFRQHASDGTHGNVTATSMRAGQIGASGIFTVAPPIDWFPAPLDVPAGVSVVQITPQAGFSPIIWGLRQAGQ